jgi:UDP-glucuronate 4-epimerase
MSESWRALAKPCRILVTGAAGFVGYHLCKQLLSEGHTLLGVDNLNDYYSPLLKQDRIARLNDAANFQFQELSIHDETYTKAHLSFKPEIVIHMAAQAGVRYSIDNPWTYIQSNIVGFQRILETLRLAPVKHFVFASSSSVYGKNSEVPYKVTDRTDSPISLYAATKKSNELIGSTYAHLYKIPMTGLRFFTVYGSWGRPDMAYFNFTKKILSGEPIEVFNNGQLKRDFTHVTDIVESIRRLIHLPPTDEVPYRLMNIGASQPVKLLDFIQTLEEVLQKKANLAMKPMQAGDVYQTFADTRELEELTGYKPNILLKNGLIETSIFEKARKRAAR